MTIPWKDPIVEDTRLAGRQLASETGDDVHAFFERLRRAQQRYAPRVVDGIEPQPASTSSNPPPASAS
jgi:hypothetical protein